MHSRLSNRLSGSRLAGPVMVSLVVAGTFGAGGLTPARAQDRPALNLSLEDQFTYFLHYIAIGRYDIANAYGRDLLGRPDLDPAQLLRFADARKKSVETMLTIAAHATLGESVQGVLEVIQQGRVLRRKEPARIRTQLDRLAGAPRSVHLGTVNLRESGEYAVPWLVNYMRDPNRRSMLPRLVNAYPQIGLGALNPSVVALKMGDDDITRRFIVDSLGQLGYSQAVPYLKQIVATDGVGDDLRAAATAAVQRIAGNRAGIANGSAASAFVDLAEQYYANRERSALRADPRVPMANVWYWRDNFLKAVPVPTQIFDEVMCMRACEQALELEPGKDAAVALWLAANFRREAQLGMNVESEMPDDIKASKDATRPDDFARSIVFARAFGARYNLMALDRAIHDVDPAVALGSVAALTVTAGSSSLMDSPSGPSPLARALTFPDLVVRIKAALALGKALPTKSFRGHDEVVPVLSEALAQTGRRSAVVVDPKQSGLNDVQGKLRSQGFEVIGESNFLKAVERARTEVPFVDVIFVASDIAEPDLSEALESLRANPVFAATPVVILFEPQHTSLAQNLALSDVRVSRVLPGVSAERLVSEWRSVSAAVGRLELSRERALELALDAAETLRGIAVSRSSVYDFNKAESALIAALAHPEEALRIRAASVLALAGSASAQQAIAGVALNPQQTVSLRSSAFASLAESAKNNGRKLDDDQINRLIQQAVAEANPVVRAAASKALGAMNVESNQASKIIRDRQQG